MKSIICTEAGNFNSIQIQEKEMPKLKENEVLVQVKAVGLSTSDYSAFFEKMETGKVSFLAKKLTENKPFGGDISGVVIKAGKKVSSLKMNDKVYASIGVNGGCSEYVVVDAKKVCLKPNNLSFEEAAAIPTSGLVALEACIKANIQPNSSVLIYGSSGGVGSFALQIAKHMQGNVTAVCSTENIENMVSLGADKVIDYTKTNIVDINKKFDCILGINGNISLKTYKSLLNQNGTYVAVGGKSATNGLLGPIYSIGSNKHMTFVLYANAIHHDHLQKLKELSEQEKIKPLIETIIYPNNIKQELERICKKHAKGKNVISMNFDEK